MKGRLLGIMALLVWGVIKTPLEIGITAERTRLNMGQFKVTASLRQQVGQAGFIAVLGGLRATVADFVWIRANSAWERTEYGRMKVDFDICTSLQPRRENFWDMAAWHMAWNGSVYVQESPQIKDPYERAKEVENYYKLGEDYLLQGVANNPDSWLLWERLGGLYRDKYHDYCKAAWAYGESAKRPGALSYVRRFAAMFLADCPGHEREAYEKMLALYREGNNEWLPGLLTKLHEVEEKLGIPKDQRVPISPKDLIPPKKK